jgi:pimeloyl-ACP methyl ester carboxylesterase
MSTVENAPSFAGLTGDGTDSDGRPPIVLLHGLTFDRTMWRPALAKLETLDPGRRVLALDLPGHGGSVRLPTYRLEDVAETSTAPSRKRAGRAYRRRALRSPPRSRASTPHVIPPAES